MKIVSYKQIETNEWNTFCKKHNEGWFWHTSNRIEHAMNASRSIKSINESFAVMDEKKIMAIAPLTIDKYIYLDLTEIGYGGFGTPLALVSDEISKNRRSKIYTLIFEYIDMLAHKYDAKRALMIKTLKYPIENTENKALEYGYNDISQSTQIIDLSKEKANIFNEFSNNHKRSIEKAKKILDVEIYDHQNINTEIFTEYEEFYKKAAGENVRPKKVFDLSYEYLINGCAALCIAKYKKLSVGFLLVIYYKNMAYFLNSAKEDAFNLCPISHLMHWKIILFLKKMKINFYEIGLRQFNNNLSENPSQKQLNISLFKKGFGGNTITKIAAEKFYDKGYAKKILSERVENFIAKL